MRSTNGNRIFTNIGSDLNIESRQDTARFDSQQQSPGALVCVGMGNMGGSLSISQGKVNADSASVNERSGIQPQDGGFDIKVQSKTDLVGGPFSSTQRAAGLLEQAFLPSLGKVIVDTLLVNQAAELVAKKTGIPLVIVIEVVEREMKPRLQYVRDNIEKITGMKQ